MRNQVDRTLNEKLGTDWVAPGKGASLADIYRALDELVSPSDENRITDLQLTGEPIVPYDRERLRNCTILPRIA